MFQITEKNLENIPYYEILPPCPPKGEIILYHGWGTTIHRQSFRAKILASEGYKVIVPELYRHGQRGFCDYERLANAGIFFETLVRSVEEGETLMRQTFSQYLPHFIVGHSLGGMIALGALSSGYQNINGIVAMNSAPEWEAMASLLEGIFPNYSLEEYAVVTEKHDAILNQVNHISLGIKEASSFVPILLMNGQLDTTIPAKYNESFCKKLKNNNLIKHLVFEDTGHVVTDRMLFEATQFMAQCFKEI